MYLRSEDNLRELVNSFHLVGLKNQTQVIRCGNKYHYLLSSLLSIPINFRVTPAFFYRVANREGRHIGDRLCSGDKVLKMNFVTYTDGLVITGYQYPLVNSQLSTSLISDALC